MTRHTHAHVCRCLLCAVCKRAAQLNWFNADVTLHDGHTGQHEADCEQICVSPGVQKFSDCIVFFTEHIFALYLPAGSHCSSEHALAAAPRVLRFHGLSSQARLTPSMGMTWLMHAIGGHTDFVQVLQPATPQPRSNTTVFAFETRYGQPIASATWLAKKAEAALPAAGIILDITVPKCASPE